MNSTFLNKIVLNVLIIGVFAVGGTFAQAAKQPARRNSPFSPNPKKKVETVNPTGQNDKTVEISKVESPVNDTADAPVQTAVLQNENAESGLSENFESRSAANKTLEVAKRANAAAVSPTEIYKTGIGDILFISLQNAPAKETNYFTVLKDGTIDYPLAGEMVTVSGLTVEEIEDLLKEKIKLYENPQVSVKVREHNSHAFTVLGLVENAGEKYLQREAIPLYVVRAEAVVQSKADRVTIKRNGAEIQNIDLRDPKYGETLIFPGDIVEFTVDENAAGTPQFYYIGGSIQSGGQKEFYQGITLTQAILASGGLKKTSVRKVVIRRKNEAGMLAPTEFDLKSIKEGKIVDPILQAGDTVEIGN